MKVSISVEKGKTVIRPLVTWRAVKPPHPKGHRQWMGEKR